MAVGANFMKDYTYAKLAYDAYCKARDWKSVRGEPLPHFEQQSPELQDAWMQAADAVAADIIKNQRRG